VPVWDMQWCAQMISCRDGCTMPGDGIIIPTVYCYAVRTAFHTVAAWSQAHWRWSQCVDCCRGRLLLQLLDFSYLSHHPLSTMPVLRTLLGSILYSYDMQSALRIVDAVSSLVLVRKTVQGLWLLQPCCGCVSIVCTSGHQLIACELCSVTV
jgi:hypothetical protein